MAKLTLEAMVSDVTGTFEEPRKVWLFGSRRHGDGTDASDVDLIVETADGGGAVDVDRASVDELLRRFHGFVDLFLLRGSAAVSLDSGCALEGGSPEALLDRIGAELVWESGTGWIGEARGLEFTIDPAATPARTNIHKPDRHDGRSVPLKPGA